MYFIGIIDIYVSRTFIEDVPKETTVVVGSKDTVVQVV